MLEKTRILLGQAERIARPGVPLYRRDRAPGVVGRGRSAVWGGGGGGGGGGQSDRARARSCGSMSDLM